MDNCPICKSLLIPTGTSEDPAWVEDPICTPGSLAGVDYRGQTPVRITHITQLQNYYTYIATQLGITLPTWIVIDRGQIKKAHVEQVRIAVEQILTALGKTLADYFSGDKYGNIYTSTQIEWTDCARTNGIPYIPKGAPIRAIHIEELRIGLVAGVLTSVEYPRNLSVSFNDTGTLYIVKYSGSFIFTPSSFDGTVEVYQNSIYYGGFGYPEITLINASAKNFIIKIVFPNRPTLVDLATSLENIRFIVRTSIGNYVFHFGRYGYMQYKQVGWLVIKHDSYGRTQTHKIESAYKLQRHFGEHLGTYTPIQLDSTIYATNITDPPRLLETATWEVTTSDWVSRSLGEDTWNYGYEYFYQNINGGSFGIRGLTYQCSRTNPPNDPLPIHGEGEFYCKMQKGINITDIFELTVTHDNTLI